MTISRARTLALLQPVIAVGSGALAAWLFVQVHLLGIFHVSQSSVAKLIASGTVFLVTASLSWLAQHQRLVPITSAIRLGVALPAIPFTPEQIVRFLAPYISVVAGAFAAWLLVHVHFLGVFHIEQTQVVNAIASSIVFGLTAVLTWLGHQFHILPTLYPPPRHVLRQKIA